MADSSQQQYGQQQQQGPNAADGRAASAGHPHQQGGQPGQPQRAQVGSSAGGGYMAQIGSVQLPVQPQNMSANRSPSLANFSQPSRYSSIPSMQGHPPTYQPYQMGPSMSPYGRPHASAPNQHPYHHAFPTHPHPVAYTPYTPYMHAPQHHLPHGHPYASPMSFNHLGTPLDPNAILPLPGGPSPRPAASDALALPTPPAAFQTVHNPPAPALPVPPPIQNEVPFRLPTPPPQLKAKPSAENAYAAAGPSTSAATTSAAAAAPTPAIAPAAPTPKPAAERPPPRRASIAAAANLPGRESSTSPQPLRARLRAPAQPAPAPVVAPAPVPAHKPRRRKGQPGRRPKNGKSGDGGAAKRRASRGGWGTGGGNRPETFLRKLWKLLKGDPEDVSEYLRWDKSGRLIIIPDEKVLVEKVCKVHFAQKNITSFNKQMNNWDFKRHSRSQRDIAAIAKAEPGVTRQTRIWYHTTLRSDSSWDDVNAVGRHEDGLAKKRRVKSKTTGIMEEGPGIGRTKRKKGTPPSIGKRSDDERDDEKPSRSQSPEAVDGPSSSVGKRAAALRKTMPAKKRRKTYDSSDESDDFSDSSEEEEGSEDESGSGDEEEGSESGEDLSGSEDGSEKVDVKGKGKAKAQLGKEEEEEDDEDAEGEPDEEILEQQEAAAATAAKGKGKAKPATPKKDTPVKGKARAASSAPSGSKPPPTKRARTDNPSTAPAPTTKRAAAAAAAKAAAAKAEEEEKVKAREAEEQERKQANEAAQALAAAKPDKAAQPAKPAGGRRSTRRSLAAAPEANEGEKGKADEKQPAEDEQEGDNKAAEIEAAGEKQDEEMHVDQDEAKDALAVELMQVDEQVGAANADGDADADADGESDEDAEALKSISAAGTRRTRSSRGDTQASPAATSAAAAKKPSAAQKFSRPVRDRTSTGRATRQQQPAETEPAVEGEPAPAKNTRAGRRSLANEPDVAKQETAASTAQTAAGRGKKGKAPAANARKAAAVPLVAGAAAPVASTSTSGTAGRKLKGRGGGWYTSPQDEVQSHDMRRGGAGYRAGSASMDGGSVDGSSASGSSNGDPPMMLSLNPQTGGRPLDGYSLPRPPHLVAGARDSSTPAAGGTSAFSPTPSASAGMARSPSAASMQVYYPDSSNPYGSSPYPSYPHQQQAPVATHRHPIRRHVAPYFSEPGRARPAYHYHGAEPIARPYVNPAHQVTDEMLEDGDEADVYGAEFAASVAGQSNGYAAPPAMDGYGDEQGFGYYQQAAPAPEARSRNPSAGASDSASMFSLLPGGYKRPDAAVSDLRGSPKGEGEDADMQDGGREGSWPRTMTRGASELFPDLQQQQRDDRYASDF
ncbi:hypothetical protein JCM10296v2_000960 [Rhodotorula toruloides]